MLAFTPHHANIDWGFFGHRKINRMAVFTLPEALLPLYKKYITYLEEHSVDPDKRRYATKHEAVRHYIDLDQWGNFPFDHLPKDFTQAIAYHSAIYVIDQNQDTSVIQAVQSSNNKTMNLVLHKDTIVMTTTKAFHYYYKKYVMPVYYEDEWVMNTDTFNQYFKTQLKDVKLIVKDTLSGHGILPYYLPTALDKLTKAFANRDLIKILRLSAEIGHYIGDAHVPLHTSKNYNGQLTDQVGIHAFWESRLPELFANQEYDFFVGKADYIEDANAFFWDIVLKSHSYLEDVLKIEKQLSQTFPSDQQWCYDERLGQTIRIQCESYARAYHEAMQGMVEDRMSSAIHATGSIWYTAWINSGQPDIDALLAGNEVLDIKEEDIKENPNVKSRDHEH
jgi:hypothetical protein